MWVTFGEQRGRSSRVPKAMLSLPFSLERRLASQLVTLKRISAGIECTFHMLPETAEVYLKWKEFFVAPPSRSNAFSLSYFSTER